MRIAVALAAVLTALALARSAAANPPDHAPAPTQPDVPDPARGQAPSVFEADRVEVAPGHKPISELAVENLFGDLRIEGHDGLGLLILSYKRAPNDDVLERLRVSLIPDPDGRIRIVTAIDPEGAPVPRSKVRIDLVIQAPRSTKVDGRVGDGGLELVNMDAGAELDTARGTIHVENVAGPVFARSLAGDQRFAEVFGIVDAQAISADVLLDTVRGERLIAAVHDGRIDGRRVRSRRVELRTTRGDISLDGEVGAGGAVTAASARGSIDIRVRAGGALRVRAHGGTVTVAGGQHLGDGEWAFGAGGRPSLVELRSRFGAVRFSLLEN